MLGAAVACGTAGVAFASTVGRQSVPPPVTTPAPPGGFTAVVTTVTIGPAGGVVPVTIDGVHITVDIPAGAFPSDVQLTVTAPDLGAITPTTGFTVTTGVGIHITLDGAPYPGTFLKPVTVSFTSPRITPSSVVVVWNGSSFVTDPNSTATAGSASVSFDTDPKFAVESPTTAKVTPVPGATSPTTGEPFLGEGILAVVLVLSGAGGVVMSRRRRVKAASTGRAQELPAVAGTGGGWGISPRMPQPAFGKRQRHTGRQEAATSQEEKSVYGSGTRSSVAGIVIGALTAAALAACSSSGSASGQQTQSATIKPQQIFAAPKNLLAAGQPQPNGTLWTLAGDAASKGLFDINLANGSGVGSVSVSNAANSVTESLGGVIGLALGTAKTGALELLNGSTGKVIKTIPLGAPARDVIVGSGGATFYVLDGTAKSASVTIVNSQNGDVQGTVPMPLNTVSVAPDSLGTSLYALQPDGQVSQVAIAGGKVMTSFPTGPGARSIALSPDGSTMYVLRNVGRDANVAEVNAATESVRQVLPAPANCLQVLVSADGSQLYQLVGTSAYGNIQVFKS
jgi:hypothetical protein